MLGDRITSCVAVPTQKISRLGGSPGLVVMGGYSCSEGHGFKSQHHILDGHFFTVICCKICNDFSFKRPKINDNRDRGWPIFLKKIAGFTHHCFRPLCRLHLLPECLTRRRCTPPPPCCSGSERRPRREFLVRPDREEIGSFSRSLYTNISDNPGSRCHKQILELHSYATLK